MLVASAQTFHNCLQNGISLERFVMMTILGEVPIPLPRLTLAHISNCLQRQFLYVRNVVGVPARLLQGAESGVDVSSQPQVDLTLWDGLQILKPKKGRKQR